MWQFLSKLRHTHSGLISILPLYLKARLGCTLGLWLVWNTHWALLNKRRNDEVWSKPYGRSAVEGILGGFRHRSSGLHSTISGEYIILSRAFQYLQSMNRNSFTDCRGSLTPPDNKTDLDMECRENTAGENQSTAVRDFSVWLSWKGAPPISVLPVFALQGGWLPVYGPPSPPLLPGPSSRCRRETRGKCQFVGCLKCHVLGAVKICPC